ncbi:MAG: hypothetical protein JWM28_2319, partial [Chitinophagaceae bacterium]|nr:hypothetical protein [Chitinophagaceae bacterium]
NEWPAAGFETDLGTDIKYAIDNDGANLYMAMNIANEGIQLKIMRMGMNMYIDLKGKKKEGRGITFPVKEEKKADETQSVIKEESEARNNPQKKLQDKKVMRSMMALHQIYMKIFGFEGSGSQDQGLSMPGSINVAFSWDSLDVLHIEWLVPLKMLGDISSLDQKEISVGWKLNGMYPSDNPRYYSEQTKSGGHQKIGADNKPIIERETIVREQNIWKKYHLGIPGNQNNGK